MAQGRIAVIVVNIETVPDVEERVNEAMDYVEWFVGLVGFSMHNLERPHITCRTLAKLVELYSPFGGFILHINPHQAASSPRAHRLIDADILLRHAHSHEALAGKGKR
ncbi:hypothetical protein ElyMa_000412900 [Elysia marginata]|uniref:Uncharacterized protein n=1 Tax=Elysia marginata TaxID=1093978 RepID=A0AAV4FJY1_9GAST|nr:hypothetical protein ElyMa_000412900 [Elysia marginata]